MEHSDPSSALLTYLNQKWSISTATDKEDLQALFSHVASHFWSVFNVYVKQEPPLLNFKYDQSLCESWNEPLLYECRGTIVRRGKRGWEILSRPFNKFFNQNEGNSPVQEPSRFNAICSEFVFTEKADGTCVQLWYERDEDEDKQIDYKKWRVSTLGTITPDEWVTTLFWRLFKTEKLKELDTKVTYLFEICSEINRVVTVYDKERIFLIGAREIRGGRHFTMQELNELAQKLEVDRPKQYSFKELGITNLKDTIAFVESEATKNIYGRNPEGFVIYHNNMPLCKLKNKSYVQKHGVVTGNLLYVRNIVIERFFADSLDDVQDVLTQPPILEFLKELKLKVKAFIDKVESIRRDALLSNSEGLMENQKAYVDAVNQRVEAQYRGFFLQKNYKEAILNKDNDNIGALVFQWLRRREIYNKYNNLWKETTVREIIELQQHMNGHQPDNNNDE